MNKLSPRKTCVLPKLNQALRPTTLEFDDDCLETKTMVPGLKTGGSTRTATLPSTRNGPGGAPSNGGAPSRNQLNIVMLGLSITSSRDNDHADHATTYRGLIRELTARGHQVLFLERDTEMTAANRDLPHPPPGRTESYASLKELKDRFGSEIRAADFVLVGSQLQEGIAIGEWITRTARGATAFYDLDTSITIASLIRGGMDHLSAGLIPRYDLYLSFTGGPILHFIETHYGARMARPLYRSVDATLFFPEERVPKWDLGYLGDYREDHQSALNHLLLEPAQHWGEGRFVVAGTRYPRTVHWPGNVKRLRHVPSARLRSFYASQRYALHITRAGTVVAGFSPGVRLFEAAACGTPIITDSWAGLETFFKPDEEILVSHSSDETLIYLEEISELDRRRMAYRARERVLAKHTFRHRAQELEAYVVQVLQSEQVNGRQ